MYWSKYNMVLESSYGRFIYNTYTNNLMKMEASLISCIDKIMGGDFSDLSEDEILVLKKNMILVDDDTNIYRSIKLQRSLSRLDTSYLTLTIAPTTACNFKCVYCYESGIAPSSAKAQSDLLEDTMSFVKLFKNTKYLRVTWYGGEPLLQFEYIENLSHRLMEMFDNYNAHMITNAYLLDKTKSEKLKELKITAIQVTIDGLEEVHNKRRPHKQNNDSFQRIVHNLDDLFSIYPEISIGFRVNVDKSNQSEYSRIYSFLKERYGKYNINIHPGYVTDDFSAEPNNCCFEADEVNKFVLEQYDNHNIPISLYPHPLFGECSARHITSFVIGPEGELYKCWNDIGIKEKTIGTVKEVSLSNELLLKYLLENDPLSDTNCENCSCFPICEGGCPYKRIYQKDGQENFCKAKRKGIIDKLKRHIDFKYKNNKIIQEMKALFVIIMGLCLNVSYAQEPDTTKTLIQAKELDEVVVKASYLTRESDHILAIPTKEQRKHAVTGYDLLNNLMIPGVSVERSTGSVTTPAGAATLYIDGREVDFREVQSLRPKDIARVEYFDVPTGKYAKDAYAINIVMKPLNNGGYTQLDAFQGVGYLNGDYNLISKFVTGTKSLNLWAGYSLENPKSSTNEKEVFRFPDYP